MQGSCIAVRSIPSEKLLVSRPILDTDMGTVVAIETETGVAIAGDGLVVDDDTVTGEGGRRVFEFDSVGVAAVGDPGDVQEFGRQLESAVRSRELERGESIDVESLARIAARQAGDANVEAVVGARDGDGVARIREVGSDGRVLENDRVALGSGAEIALGRLESIGDDREAGDVATTVREVLETVVARDAGTGGEVVVWSLDDETSADTRG